MSIGIFLEELKKQGIEIVLSGNKNNLEVNFKDNLSETIINEIKANKTEIIDYLNSSNPTIPKAAYSAAGYPLTPSQKEHGY